MSDSQGPLYCAIQRLVDALPVAFEWQASLQSLAQKINLPHKQVMLTQCDAVLHEASVTGICRL